MSIRLLLILFFTCLTLNLRADITLGKNAYEYGDYITAFREFTLHAENGDPVAGYHLAFMFYEGEGVEKNQRKAFHWFRQSAERNYAPAQDTLAYFYNHGIGTEQDTLRAYVWYSIAAANGIFLAESIKVKLGKDFSPSQQTQADIMIQAYQTQMKENF